MKRFFSLAAGLWFIASPAPAAQLMVWPPEATTQDPLVLEVRSAPPCATVIHDAIVLLEGGIVRVPFDDGSRVLCSAPSVCALRIPLGRLPAGHYTVEFVPDRPSLTHAAAVQFTVYGALVPDFTPNPYRHGLSHRDGRVSEGCRTNTLEMGSRKRD